ncbi:MAG: choice-of-anchor Q domain-containing protein [Bacteroidales bacterium]
MIGKKLKILVKSMIFLLFIVSCNAEFNYPHDMPELPYNPWENTYYVDSESGNDRNNGRTERTPFRSTGALETLNFSPGAVIHFKRGSAFTGPLYITDSGTAEDYIRLTDYGDAELPAPSFTNQVFEPENGNYGNCIRLQGSYIIVENLYFHSTVADLPETTGGFETMWELGAVYIDKEAEYCIVRNNEIYDCGVGIKSYGPFASIESNYIHDCNRVLKRWSWGPIGIWLGADNQEVSYNRIFNYSAVDPNITWGPDAYGGGADGGAIEIDDARNNKSNISIHHNYSRDCQGFLEVTWSDVVQKPDYRDFEIHHNVSDDYQQFIALWRGKNCKIENNTIIRRKVNVNDWGVFNITQYNSQNLIRNNIVVVENDVVIFNLGKNGNANPGNIIENNLYHAASGSLNIGLEGPGRAAVFADPLLLNYQEGDNAVDFSITSGSPAIDAGRVLGYQVDLSGTSIPQNNKADIGAFEYPSE